MVVPPKHPKTIIFSKENPMGLLGKPTILGNSQVRVTPSRPQKTAPLTHEWFRHTFQRSFAVEKGNHKLSKSLTFPKTKCFTKNIQKKYWLYIYKDTLKIHWQ